MAYSNTGNFYIHSSLSTHNAQCSFNLVPIIPLIEIVCNKNHFILIFFLLCLIGGLTRSCANCVFLLLRNECMHEIHSTIKNSDAEKLYFFIINRKPLYIELLAICLKCCTLICAGCKLLLANVYDFL